MLDFTIAAYERWRHTAHAMASPSPLDTWCQAGDMADAWALEVAAELLQACPGGWPDTPEHFDHVLTGQPPGWRRLLQWQISKDIRDPDDFSAVLVLPSGRTVMDYVELQAMLEYLAQLEDLHRDQGHPASD